MNRQRFTILLGVTIAFQIFVLIGMVARATLPLWIGTEIRVETVPVDPRSLFRGNYARLRYEFGILPYDALSTVEGLRVGEIVYVTLREGEGGKFEFMRATMERPTNGMFLRGRLVTTSRPLHVKYGIEAFFTPKERALELERDLRNGGIAILMVTDAGRAALKDVVPNREPDLAADPSLEPDSNLGRDSE